MFAGGEEWSCSLRSTVLDPLPAGGLQTVCNSLATTLGNWFTAGSIVSNFAALGWVKFNQVGVDGKQLGSVTAFKDLAPVAAGSSSGTYPAQVALVATLETGLTRGLAHRGRIFLPSPKFPVDADGRITQANADACATSVASLISSINAVTGYGSTIVASKGGINQAAGDQRSVTGVTVGRVLDTMRSRRTSLPEERTTVKPVTGF